MGQMCKGVCIQYKGPRIQNGKRYESGQKRCSYCDLFIQTEEIRCPCCGVTLRTKPRS